MFDVTMFILLKENTFHSFRLHFPSKPTVRASIFTAPGIGYELTKRLAN